MGLSCSVGPTWSLPSGNCPNRAVENTTKSFDSDPAVPVQFRNRKRLLHANTSTKHYLVIRCFNRAKLDHASARATKLFTRHSPRQALGRSSRRQRHRRERNSERSLVTGSEASRRSFLFLNPLCVVDRSLREQFCTFFPRRPDSDFCLDVGCGCASY